MTDRIHIWARSTFLMSVRVSDRSSIIYTYMTSLLGRREPGPLPRSAQTANPFLRIVTPERERPREGLLAPH